MSSTTTTPPATGPAPEQAGMGDYARAWWQRTRGGDFGAIPIIVGLAVIVAIFGTLDPVFLTSANFVNLLLQMAGIATIGIGIVFVLLIAEIDLSVGYVSAVGGVVTTLLLRPGDPGWPWWAAILAGLAVTTAIGFAQGLVITTFGVPSFVVTLAGFLAWSGVVLILTTETSQAGTIIIQDPVVLGLSNRFLPDVWGWALAAGVTGGYAAVQLRRQRSRLGLGLDAKPMSVLAAQVAGIALVTGFAAFYANRDRGIPVVALVLLAFIAVWTLIASRTRFGRHVYAVGGNPEAARRAGIDVTRLRIAVFMIAGFMAGVGGIILASRLRSVSTNTGSGNLLLEVIAAAVIGGTSLFGGRGRVISALLGALVIASVSNGMDLLGLPAGVKFVVTGLVLLAAVLVDSISKRGRAA
jgi:D-xylose transport system permease protein